jgi:mono/diheme cytochrome c family protein
VDAALSGMRGVERAVLERLLDAPAETSAHRAAITMIAATIIRSKREQDIQDVWAWTSSPTRAAWQRAALLEGAEVALTGAPAPGTPRRATPQTASAAPCPTCPGGRGGPGGARAFPEVLSEGAAQPSRATGPALVLGGEPALLRLADEPTELGQRAARVLARVGWPGKPGSVADAPLTADEQRRFDAGRVVYENACVGCHQADGRGVDRVAPSLVGSSIVLGSVPIAVRVLLHGKEGGVGLMPPLGATLNDDQIAEVLTYVRRGWGHTASTVVPDTVREVRGQTSNRRRPWTAAELAALAQP